MVRGRNGPIPWLDGPSALAIRAWREKRAAGESRGLEDYHTAHGICFECLGHGAKMIGWSKPANELDEAAVKEFSLNELPVYDVCSACQGTGKRWRGREL